MRPFEISGWSAGESTILRVTGELDAANATALRQALAGEIASSGSVVVDLSECDFIDSAGIAAIVEAWQGFDGPASRGKVVLAGPRGQVDRIIRITGLDQNIAIFDEVEQAVASGDLTRSRSPGEEQRS